MKSLSIFLLLIIWSNMNLAFAAETFLNRIEGIEYCLSVSPTADAGMIISGNSIHGDSIIVVKTDKDGMEQWNHTFASIEFIYSRLFDNFHSDIKQTGDGGYILINTIQNADAAVRVSKLDTLGNVQWSQTYDNEGDDMSRQVLYTKDGGFLFLYSNDAITYMVKTDSAGNEQWTKTETISGFTDFDFQVHQTSDNGYIFCRKSDLVKYDLNGETEWRQGYSGIIRDRVEQLKSGGYVIIDYSGGVEMTDTSGNMLWQVKGQGPINNFTISSNDEIILAGTKLTKMNLLAKIIWQKDLPYKNIKDIYTEADGSIILAGQFAESVGFLARYSSEGESPRYLVLLGPGDGDKFPVDTKIDISWISSDLGDINIEWTNEYQNDWIFIARVADSLKKYEWHTAGSPSLHNKIRISSVLYPETGAENKTGFSVGARHYDYIAINEIMMYFATDGDGSYDMIHYGAGFYWPGGENATQTAVFIDGPVWGGLVNGDTLVNGSTYNHGLQPGNIISTGVAADRNDPDVGIYKARPDWESLAQGPFKERLEYDWNHWPVQLGAPWIDVNGDGIYDPQTDHPDITGDEMNWMVMNDLDSVRSKDVYGAYPVGIEVQLSIYGYNTNDILKDVVFKKYKHINKGNNTVDSMYFAYWSDADLGFAGDDYAGCDTLLNLLYCFNANNEDLVYPGAPPAVGYLLLQGPMVRSAMSDSAFAFNQWQQGYKNIKMTATMLYTGHDPWYRDPTLRSIKGSREMWNNMRGRFWNGTPIINPVTEVITNYVFPGDPVSETGWYEGGDWYGPATDYRMLMSSGPLTFAPGDSQEVVYAIIMARGEDRLDSVRKLKQKAAAVREFYYTGVLPITLIENENRITPDRFVLYQNYPNPFNPTTMIKYTIGAKYNSPLQVSLIIYDVLGREVKTLVNKRQNAGTYKITFNAAEMSSGVYYYKLKVKTSGQSGSFEQTKKMLLIK